MKKQNVILALFSLTILLFIISCTKSAALSSQYNNFAKCLTDKGVKFYGAFWCSHCNNQKTMLGTSMQYVDYIECSTPDGQGQTQVCPDANIDSYPTWEFSGGSRIKGEMALLQLSQKSGCSLS
ncbi:MAG TPA: hypothetical protein VJI52_06480 [Candidatus Nanoarchaeia archaeon]|nr:hypothetical protein [Candidatus Nanoarchaeia archaeon]